LRDLLINLVQSHYERPVFEIQDEPRFRTLHSIQLRYQLSDTVGRTTSCSGDKDQKIGAALKQLDISVTDLHSASDEGNQADAETALKAVESALDQLKAQDPEATFKSMH
jgi:hypothetical protein